jgi:NAD(P)-dependent dehydrogenase (short-subunit alcohol dehydrogenase family)
MSGRLAGKRVLVSGAGAGIGHSVAAGFAAEGARLALLDGDERGLAETAATLAALGADVFPRLVAPGVEADVCEAFAAVTSAWGGLDVVVVNAAVGVDGDDGPLEALDVGVWRRALDANLTPVFVACKHGLRALQANGAGQLVCLIFPAVPSDEPPGAAFASSVTAIRGLVDVAQGMCGGGAITVSAIVSAQAGASVALSAVPCVRADRSEVAASALALVRPA